MSTPRLIVAAPSSGSGKTTVTAVLLTALRERGLHVQAFKLGPDFIDPGYHAEATGHPSINLDLWMMGEDGVLETFERSARQADICVIESMGALFDGERGTDRGSAAHLAKLLGAPVVLAVDVWGMTRTTAAVLQGMVDFDPEVDIAGVVLNRIGSAGHEKLIRGALPAALAQRVVGAVEHHRDLEIPERHLGLLTPEENSETASRSGAQRRAAAMIDVDRLLEISRDTRPAAVTSTFLPPRADPVARLAVARDQAFCFYYEENLRALRDAGFELVFFSPLRDHRLPVATDAVYLGGGYPESFAAELSANRALADELRQRTASGMPLHAECGGLIYLARTLTGFDGVRHEMSGLLPLDVEMDPHHLAIRYVEARTTADSPLGPAGTTVRGQEFHQSRIVASEVAASLFETTSQDGDTSVDGYQVRNLTASYLHLYLATQPAVVADLLRCALTQRVTALP